jgi:hypothetical protein
MSELFVTATEFEKRLTSLCQSGSAFPRRHRDRHILYRSIVQTFDVSKNYSERSLNTALQQWLSEVGNGIDIDHVTLRRYLIDEAYLSRDAKGSTYAVNPTGRGHVQFEPAVASIDSSIVIHAAKTRVAARKREQSAVRA